MFSNKIREKSCKLPLNASKEMLGFFFSFKFKKWLDNPYLLDVYFATLGVVKGLIGLEKP